MSELKPCPFCEADGKLVNLGAPMVVCTKGCCHAARENCVEQWNTRPIEDDLRAELARRNEERNALADENRMLSERIQRLAEGIKSRDEIIARLKERLRYDIRKRNPQRVLP